jgi:hypothetical protein
MTPQEIAEMLGRRLRSLGHDPHLLDQVDFVECEDGGATIVANNWFRDGDLVPLAFDRVEFDPSEVEALLKEGLTTGTLH